MDFDNLIFFIFGIESDDDDTKKKKGTPGVYNPKMKYIFPLDTYLYTFFFLI